MEGDNLSALAPGACPFGGQLGSGSAPWVVIAAVIMLPTVYLRDLSLLAYLSAAGIFASVITAALVGWEGASDGACPHLSSCRIPHFARNKHPISLPNPCIKAIEIDDTCCMLAAGL